MKAKFLAFTLLGATVMLAACTETPNMPAPGDNTNNQDSIYVAPNTPIPDSIQINVINTLKEANPDHVLNVREAYKVGKALGSGGTTTDKYYIYGWVTSLDSKHASGMSSYGNGTFYMAANVDGLQNEKFEAYQVYGKGGAKFTAAQADAVAAGDFVVIYGLITNYSGTIETTGRGAAYVYYSNNPLW